MALKRTWLFATVETGERSYLLAAGVLGDGLGALTDSVLSKLTGQKQTNSSLNLATGDGGTLVVVSQTRSFGSNALENVVDKAVHDGHSLGADASVGVHLLEHLVDVDGIAFLSLPLTLLVAGADSLGLAGLLRTLRTDFRRHVSIADADRVTEPAPSALSLLYSLSRRDAVLYRPRTFPQSDWWRGRAATYFGL